MADNTTTAAIRGKIDLGPYYWGKYRGKAYLIVPDSTCSSDSVGGVLEVNLCPAGEGAEVLEAFNDFARLNGLEWSYGEPSKAEVEGKDPINPSDVVTL